MECLEYNKEGCCSNSCCCCYSFAYLMENKIVTFLLAILLALGGWNLSQTFKLSNDMVLVKEKISNIEDKVSKFKPNKKKKKKKN